MTTSYLEAGDIATCAYSGHAILICRQHPITYTFTTLNLNKHARSPDGSEVELEFRDGNELKLCVKNFCTTDEILSADLIARALAAASIVWAPTLDGTQQLTFPEHLLLPEARVPIDGWGESPTTITEQWRTEGRCPQCGELGHFDRALSMICKTHGAY